MKTLATPSSGILVGEAGLSLSSSSRDSLVRRPESCFRRSHKFVGVLHLASARKRSVQPVFSLSPKPQVDIDVTDNKSQETYQSKTVHVKFQIQKECSFGDEFLLVGDDPMFGVWDPENGIPLTWSDDHVWTVEMDMPIGKTVQYKFILKDTTGTILWQPGPDRIFQSWETNNMITVSEEWEDAENQKLIEDDGFPNQNVEPIVNSGVLVVEEKLPYPNEEPVSKINNGSVITDNNPFTSGKSLSGTPDELVFASSIPSQEKPVAFVADNISSLSSQENPAAVVADNIGNPKQDFPSENRIGQTKKETTTAFPNKDKVITKDVVGNNSKAAAVQSSSTEFDENRKTYTSPVLVPGLPLTLSTFTATEEAVQIEGDKSSSFDVSDGPDDAKDFNVPELLKKQEPEEKEDDHAKLERQAVLANEEEEEQSYSELQMHTEQEPEEKKDHHAKFREEPVLADEEEEEQSDMEPIKEVIGNDIQWGIRKLQNLLADLGLA